MRRCLFGLSLFLPLLLGCSGAHVVAGQEKTKAEQLESALPSWCSSTCTRFLACPENTGCDCSGEVCECAGVDAGCEEQCPKAFAPYIDAGEACATIGQRVKDCYDAVDCSELNGRDPCPVTAAERARCPDLNEGSDVPPSGVGSTGGPNGYGGTSSSSGPSATGGTNLTAGTASTGGSYGTAGTAGANPVSCEGSYGAGGGAPVSGGSQVTCEEGRTGCTDGHDYSWICARDSQGRRACSCLIDAHATAGFEPVMDCPDLSAVNAGCGWALLP
jgi:hypothetical protein